jgi:hypothetical protein
MRMYMSLQADTKLRVIVKTFTIKAGNMISSSSQCFFPFAKS